MIESKRSPLTFMGVYAHPDDEVFGTGGSFALLAERGVNTILVTATMGEEGEIVDPTLDEQARQAMFPRLAEVRRQELQASAEALKIQTVRVLGFRDSGMAGTAANQHPDAFHQATFDEAVKRLVAVIRELKPQVIATFDAFGGYGHPDHIQTHRATLAAFEAAGESRCFPELGLDVWQPDKLYYSAMPRSRMIQMFEEMQKSGIAGPWDDPEMDISALGTPDELFTTRIDVRAYVDNKMRAWQAHKTQMTPASFLPDQSPQILRTSLWL